MNLKLVLYGKNEVFEASNSEEMENIILTYADGELALTSAVLSLKGKFREPDEFLYALCSFWDDDGSEWEYTSKLDKGDTSAVLYLLDEPAFMVFGL